MWKCPKCRLRIPKKPLFPVTCRCGFVDDGKPKSLAQRVKQFAAAAKHHHAVGAPLASDEQIAARLSVCRQCQNYTGSMCSVCGCYVNQGKWMNKLAWLDQACPEGKWGNVDVVIPLHGEPSSGWWFIRGTIVADFLSSIGRSGRVVQSGDRTYQSLASIIDANQPGVVVNRAMQYSAEVIEMAARNYSDTRFLTVNHSSQSHLLHAPHWIEHQLKHIELSSRMNNVWFGLVDERMPIAKHDRTVWVPNLVPEIESSVCRENDLLTASAIGRWDWAKNWPNQFAAAGIAKAAPKVYSVIKTGRPQDIHCMASTYAVHAMTEEWSNDWQTHIDRIARHVDVGLQCSFTESFNYVAIEHLSLGIPVVGSQAIRYLPREWQANPDDPRDIATTIDRLSSGGLGEQARQVAARIRKRNAEAFQESLGLILK